MELLDTTPPEPADCARQADPRGLCDVPGLVRCEAYEPAALTACIGVMNSNGCRSCSVETYIDCSPEKVFAYMANPYGLLEWTFGVRELRPTARPEILAGVDEQGRALLVTTSSSAAGMTVDYRFSWDPQDQSCGVHLNRIVGGPAALMPSGTLLITTTRARWSDMGASAPTARYAVGLRNLKAILEHRHRRGLVLGPHVVDV